MLLFSLKLFNIVLTILIVQPLPPAVLEEGRQCSSQWGHKCGIKLAGFKNNDYPQNNKWLGHEAFAEG